MMIIIDCPKCNTRHDWDPKNDDQRCPRCQLMAGNDVNAIIAELRKTRVPGQEHILRLLEVLSDKIKLLEAKSVVGKN